MPRIGLRESSLNHLRKCDGTNNFGKRGVFGQLI